MVLMLGHHDLQGAGAVAPQLGEESVRISAGKPLCCDLVPRRALGSSASKKGRLSAGVKDVCVVGSETETGREESTYSKAYSRDRSSTSSSGPTNAPSQ